MHLNCGPFRLDLARPLVMGIVNVTPDSFSDGGRFLDPAAALAQAEQLVADGADILDVGGESTRPGALPITPQEELDRIAPVLEGLRGAGVPVSVDTRRAEVMREAIRLGAAMINDVDALQAPGALELVAPTGLGVCLMHKRGEPQTMQKEPHYADVVAEVEEFLAARVAAAEAAGIGRERICVDPGFGFGKTRAHNLALMRALPRLGHGVPVLVGLSRKSVLGSITGRGPDARLHASIAAAVLAVARGARIVRVHDVAATRDALAVWNAVEEAGA